MVCERHPLFLIEFKGNSLNTRLAPGMALAYDIKFCPEEKRDYEYEATFVSDRETLRVPIIGEKKHFSIRVKFILLDSRKYILMSFLL